MASSMLLLLTIATTLVAITQSQNTNPQIQQLLSTMLICRVVQDSEFFTFDNLYYNYQGDNECAYTLSESSSPNYQFHVSRTVYQQAISQLDYPGDLRIKILDPITGVNHLIIFHLNGATRINDGMTTTTLNFGSTFGGPNYSVYNIGPNWIFQSKIGLTAIYSFPSMTSTTEEITIGLDETIYYNTALVDGLCGNMDGNSAETCNGNNLPGSPIPFGDCWQDTSYCVYSGRRKRRSVGENQCHMMQDESLFGKCATKQSIVKAALQACNADFAKIGGTSCEALNGFADNCSLHGYTVTRKWRKAANCR